MKEIEGNFNNVCTYDESRPKGGVFKMKAGLL